MDKRTKELRPFRMVVKKTGTNSFHTVLNSQTEGEFDKLFSKFIATFGTHFIHEADFGAKLVYKAHMKRFDTTEFEKDDKNMCMNQILQEKFDKKAYKQADSNRCEDSDMQRKLEKSAQIEEIDFYAKGSSVTNPSKMENVAQWTTSAFADAYMTDFKLLPILKLFDRRIMNLDRISDKFGNPVDIDGINSWMLPRYTILLNKCQNLENYIVSADGASCEECPKNRVPSLDGFKCVCGEDFETSKNGQCKSKWKVKFEITFAKIKYFHS